VRSGRIVGVSDEESLDFDNPESVAEDAGAGDEVGEAQAQRVSWAEAFFDLVVVLAVTEVSSQLQHAHSWGALARSLLLLVPFWWGWVGTALLFNGLRISPIRKHLLLFGIALGALVMSTAVPSAYGARAPCSAAPICSSEYCSGWRCAPATCSGSGSTRSRWDC